MAIDGSQEVGNTNLGKDALLHWPNLHQVRQYLPRKERGHWREKEEGKGEGEGEVVGGVCGPVSAVGAVGGIGGNISGGGCKPTSIQFLDVLERRCRARRVAHFGGEGAQRVPARFVGAPVSQKAREHGENCVEGLDLMTVV